jgi:hypothetical protein
MHCLAGGASAAAPATGVLTWRSEADAWTRCFLDGESFVRSPAGNCTRITARRSDASVTSEFKQCGSAELDLAECLPHLPGRGAAAPLRRVSFELRPDSTDHRVFVQARPRCDRASCDAHCPAAHHDAHQAHTADADLSAGPIDCCQGACRADICAARRTFVISMASMQAANSVQHAPHRSFASPTFAS